MNLYRAANNMDSGAEQNKMRFKKRINKLREIIEYHGEYDERKPYLCLSFSGCLCLGGHSSLQLDRQPHVLAI